MKKFLFLFFIMASFIVSCNKNDDSLYASKVEISNVVCDSCAKKEKVSMASTASTYGIYGEVLWPVSGTAYNAVELPTVYIYKWINNSWVLQGNTVASICGYYTYGINSTGTYRALINNYYYLRSYPGCSSRVEYGLHSGSGDGTINIWDSWIVVNVRCS